MPKTLTSFFDDCAATSKSNSSSQHHMFMIPDVGKGGERAYPLRRRMLCTLMV
jgi:hypothetical protein